MSKKIIVMFALAFAVVTVLAGCNNAATDPSSIEPSENPSTNPPIIADAALYRGLVTEISAESITVRMVSGRDYGAPNLTLAITESTNVDPSLEEIAEGDFVEIYYGGENAIMILKITLGESVVFNGEIESVAKDDDGNITSLTVVSLPIDGQEKVIFNVGAETQIYMNADELVEGKMISIYTSGVIATSEPPQSFALEISSYVPVER